MVGLGDKVVIKVGKFAGIVGVVTDVNGDKLTVKLTSREGFELDVFLYQSHVKLAK